MFEESSLISHLDAALAYTIKLDVEEKSNSWQDANNLPLVYVGHIGIKIHFKSEDSVWANGYREIENEQMLLTNVSFICARSSLVTVRNNVYNACRTFVANISNTNTNQLTFLSGDLKAATGDRVWWTDTWGYIFPRI